MRKIHIHFLDGSEEEFEVHEDVYKKVIESLKDSTNNLISFYYNKANEAGVWEREYYVMKSAIKYISLLNFKSG